jgi:hypothetical protein
MKNSLTYGSILIVVMLFFYQPLAAQSVAINNTSTPPDPSAMLDVSSTNKGILFPKVNLAGYNDASLFPARLKG